MNTKLNKESIATIELMIQDNIISQETAEKYFPELKEYHDEEIRKDLIKLVEESTKLRDYYDLRKMKKYLEKLGKQTISKFKICDWIVDELGNVLHVLDVKSNLYRDYYYKVEELNGRTYNYDGITSDNCCHIWTIQDAKPGDVLVSWNDTIFIFKNIEDDVVKYYIAYNEKWDEEIRIPLSNDSHVGLAESQFEFKPATKEQQDIFFKRMKEAGYEWDDITITLKKIDPIQQELIRIISDWDEDGRASKAGYLTKLSKKDILKWLKNKTDNSSKSIQWKGDNLQEVIRFTGISQYFNNWFKNWQEYEDYVHSHNNILKLFNADGSHYEVPVGSWIVHTPDGYNVASKAKFIPKFSDDELDIAKKDAYNDALDKIEYSSEDPTFDDGWSAAINYVKKKFIK